MKRRKSSLGWQPGSGRGGVLTKRQDALVEHPAHVDRFAVTPTAHLQHATHRRRPADQIDKLHLKVRKRALKRADPPLCDLRKLASGDLVQTLEIALLDGLMQTPDQQPVLLNRHQDPLWSSSAKGAESGCEHGLTSHRGRDRFCRAATRHAAKFYDTHTLSRAASTLRRSDAAAPGRAAVTVTGAGPPSTNDRPRRGSRRR